MFATLPHDNDALMTFLPSSSHLLAFSEKPVQSFLIISFSLGSVESSSDMALVNLSLLSHSYSLYPYIPSILTLVYLSPFLLFSSYLRPCQPPIISFSYIVVA